MRLDKYLKVSRLIKRRTVAQEAASGERVSVNGKVAKPSRDVKVGDIIEIRFGSHALVIRVLNVNEKARKEESTDMYEVIEEGKDDI